MSRFSDDLSRTSRQLSREIAQEIRLRRMERDIYRLRWAIALQAVALLVVVLVLS